MTDKIKNLSKPIVIRTKEEHLRLLEILESKDKPRKRKIKFDPKDLV